MTINPITPKQLTRWNKWLESSHGLIELPGHTIYRCDIDYRMFLTPWPNLQGFAMRQERDSEQIMISLDLVPGVRTLAHLWAGNSIPHGGFLTQATFNKAKSDLIAAVKRGRFWWGTETLVDKPFHTSVCYWFPNEFAFPAAVKLPLPVFTAKGLFL